MKVVYIAGPYSAQRLALPLAYHEIEENIGKARLAAHRLAREGVGFLCPHLNSAHFEAFAPSLTYEFMIELSLRLLRGCDGVYLLPRWRQSPGAVVEYEEAVRLRLPTFEESEFDNLINWSKEEKKNG